MTMTDRCGAMQQEANMAAFTSPWTNILAIFLALGTLQRSLALRVPSVWLSAYNILLQDHLVRWMRVAFFIRVFT